MQLQKTLTTAIYGTSYHINLFPCIQMWENSTQNRIELNCKQLAKEINEH